MIKVGNKGIADILVGNRAVAAIYRGATLVWQKIQKLLKGGYGGGKSNCYVVIPPSDIVLSDVSVLAVWNNTQDCSIKIINECGICIASSNINGIESGYTKYGFTGWLNTVSSLGTITLYAGNKYYINTKKNGDNEWSIAEYDGETSYYKSCGELANQMSVDQSAGSRKCYGSCTSFDDIKSVGINGYFIWRGPAIKDNMLPSEDGSTNPYPYLLNRDMSRVKHIFTADEFSTVGGNDIKKYAYIFYTMGQIEGDEFIMNAGDYWGAGFAIDPSDHNTKYFTNNNHKIYKLTGSMGVNHITSMTPIDNEPTNPEYGAIYYKSSANTWGNISAEAVVAWTGSWVIATDVDREWTADSNYDATNYVTKINQWTAKDFNNISEQTGSKFYFKLNNIEV